MNVLRRIGWLTCAMAMCAGTSVVDGAIIVNNLAEAVAGTAAVNGPLGGAESWVAVRFTTGVGNWSLNALTAQFSDSAALNPDGLIVDVRSDAGLNPGAAVLGSLTPTSNIGAQANYAFSPTAAISLTGNTSYWLVARPTLNASLYAWYVTGSAADNGASGWSLDDAFVGSADSGTNWTGALPAVPLLSLDATLQAAAVPEPATSSLIGCVIAVGAVRRRWRRMQPVGLDS